MKKKISTHLVFVAVLLSPMAANADLISGLCNGGISDQSVICDTETGLEWLGLDLWLEHNAELFTETDVAILEVDGWRLPEYEEIAKVGCEGGRYLGVCPNAANVALDFEQEMQTAAESSAIEKTYEGTYVAPLLVRGGSVASVPEPGTLGLLGIGLSALGLSRRKPKI